MEYIAKFKKQEEKKDKEKEINYGMIRKIRRPIRLEHLIH
jgi:hypothetical protein